MKIVSENRFSGKTCFYTIGSRKARATINTLRRELTSQAEELSSAAEDKSEGGAATSRSVGGAVVAVPEMDGSQGEDEEEENEIRGGQRNRLPFWIVVGFLQGLYILLITMIFIGSVKVKKNNRTIVRLHGEFLLKYFWNFQ